MHCAVLYCLIMFGSANLTYTKRGKPNYLIIIHHLRPFENCYCHQVLIFLFLSREELAMKIGLTEARIQVRKMLLIT